MRLGLDINPPFMLQQNVPVQIASTATTVVEHEKLSVGSGQEADQEKASKLVSNWSRSLSPR